MPIYLILVRLRFNFDFEMNCGNQVAIVQNLNHQIGDARYRSHLKCPYDIQIVFRDIYTTFLQYLVFENRVVCQNASKSQGEFVLVLCALKPFQVIETVRYLHRSRECGTPISYLSIPRQGADRQLLPGKEDQGFRQEVRRVADTK